MLKEQVRAYDKEYGHCELLTIGEYATFLGMKDQIFEDLKEIQQCPIDIFKDDDPGVVLNRLKEIAVNAMIKLQTYDNKNKFLGS